jgi:hypothetical protein
VLFVSRRDLKGQSLLVEWIPSYLFTYVHQGLGYTRFGSNRWYAGGRGCIALWLPSPLHQFWGFSLRASESHSHTLYGTHLRCKAHCASRKSHRLSVGN